MFFIVFSSAVNIVAINYGVIVMYVICAIFIIVCTSHFSLCSPREDVCTRGIRKEKRIWMDGPKINDSPRTFSWVDSFSLFFSLPPTRTGNEKVALIICFARAQQESFKLQTHSHSRGTLASAKADRP